MSETVHGYNIVTLMKRLEAATSRLEDLTVYHQDSFTKAAEKALGVAPDDSSSTSAVGSAALESSSTTTKSAKEADNVTGSATPTATVSPIITDYIALHETLKALIASSKELDSVVGDQAIHWEKASGHVLTFLEAAIKSQKPAMDDSAFQSHYQLISKEAEEIIFLREKNRGSKFINHLATVAEAIPGLGWIGSDDPASYIGDFKDSSQFYSFRILKEFKETDKRHVDWVNQNLGFWGDLQAYVKKYHAKGVAWDSSSKLTFAEALKTLPGSSELAATSTAPPAPAPGGAPGGGPPPPPPPMPSADVFKSADADASSGGSATGAGGMSAVFSELSKGESVTSGLKKVDKTQMTHKNPELRNKAPIAAPSKPTLPKKPASLSATKKRPPRKELVDGSKWMLENLEDDHDIVLQLEMDHSVFIDHCKNCTIQIKGKGNSVSVNECTKIGLLIDSLVSGASVNKSSGVGTQITGLVSTLTIDQTQDSQIYLSDKSIGCEVYTAQTASLNVNIPKPGGPDGDYTEVFLPEQIVHKFDISGTVTSKFVEHAG